MLKEGQTRRPSGRAYMSMQEECAGISLTGSVKPCGKAPMANGLFVRDGAGNKKLFVRNNFQIGYSIVRDVKMAGIYISLMKEKTDLFIIDFEMIRNAPQFTAFSKSDRQIKMGSVQ